MIVSLIEKKLYFQKTNTVVNLGGWKNNPLFDDQDIFAWIH